MKILSKGKKLGLSLLLVSCLVVGCQAAGGSIDSAEQFMKEKSIALICKIDQLAECEEYMQLYTAGDEMKESAAQIAKESYDQPKDIYYIAVPKDYDFIKALEPSSNVATLPAMVQEEVRKRAMKSLGTMLASQSGVTSVALTSLLNTGEACIRPEIMQEDTIVVLTYDKYIGIVTFTNAKEIVDIEGTIVSVDDDLRASISEDTGEADFIAGLCQMAGLECKKQSQTK